MEVCWAHVVVTHISWGRLYFQTCLRTREDRSENRWSFCWFCFWNRFWPTEFLLTLSTLQTSERLYDWLIEHQQPGEIVHHSPGLYFPFLLKFLLTHSPIALKPSLISFRVPWFDQSNLYAMFWSHFVERQWRQWPNDTILEIPGSSLLPKPPPLMMLRPPWPCEYTWAPQYKVHSLNLRPRVPLKF